MKYSTQNQMSKAGKPRNTNKRQGWIRLNYLTILSATCEKPYTSSPPSPPSPPPFLWWMSRVGQLLWAHAGITSIITPEPIVSPECGRPRNCWHVSSRRVQSRNYNVHDNVHIFPVVLTGELLVPDILSLDGFHRKMLKAFPKKSVLSLHVSASCSFTHFFIYSIFLQLLVALLSRITIRVHVIVPDRAENWGCIFKL